MIARSSFYADPNFGKQKTRPDTDHDTDHDQETTTITVRPSGQPHGASSLQVTLVPFPVGAIAMAADHRPLDTDEFISHIEEMPIWVPEEKAPGQRGKTRAIRYGVLGIPRKKKNVPFSTTLRRGSPHSPVSLLVDGL